MAFLRRAMAAAAAAGGATASAAKIRSMQSNRAAAEPPAPSFKAVPTELADLDARWFTGAFRQSKLLPASAHVSEVKITPLVGVGDAQDGGGFSGSVMVKAKLGYKGEGLTGSEPESCVVKLSLGRTDQALSERVAMAVLGLYEEDIFRTEYVGFELTQAVPGYRMPSVYYTGLVDAPTRNFLEYVLLYEQSKVKTVAVMADLSEMESSLPGMTISAERARAVVANTAKLHAHYWGDNAAMERAGPTNIYDGMFTFDNLIWNSLRDWFLGDTDKSAELSRKLLDNWADLEKPGARGKYHGVNAFSLPAADPRPGWAQPLPEGAERWFVLQDPVVLEALEAFGARAPAYWDAVLKPFRERPPQTVDHGDLHGGNHMYGADGELVAVDFQGAGAGQVAVELAYFMHLAISPDRDGEADLLRHYHETLTALGVTGYSLAELEADADTAVIAAVLGFHLMYGVLYTPDKFGDVIENHPKQEEFQTVLQSGVFARPLVRLASMYMADKEGFMAR